LASSESFTVAETTVEASKMRIIEGAMYMFYMLLAISLIAILYSSVSRFFK